MVKMTKSLLKKKSLWALFDFIKFYIRNFFFALMPVKLVFAQDKKKGNGQFNVCLYSK